MFDQLIDKVGFGWTIRTISFMLLGLQAVSLLITRSRLRHQPKPFSPLEFARPYREPVFALNSLACFFTFWGILIPFNYIELASEASGMSPRLSSYLIPVINSARQVRFAVTQALPGL